MCDMCMCVEVCGGGIERKMLKNDILPHRADERNKNWLGQSRFFFLPDQWRESKAISKYT